MFNYFLHTAFLAHSSIQDLQKSMLELNEVQLIDDIYDHFYKESNLSTMPHDCGISMMKTLFENLDNDQLRYQVLPSMLQRMTTVDPVDDQICNVSRAFPTRKNSYWVAEYPSTQGYRLSSVADYTNFRQQAVAGVSINDFWMMRHFLFPHIHFCLQTQKQVERITDVNSFKGLLDCIKKLDDYTAAWKKDGFNMNDLAQSVDASYESKETMREFGEKRKFKISDEIGKKECSAHLKSDKLRAHFYPDDVNHNIYVAYIGKHLPTHKYR